ncbi:hypothetical protein JYG23_08085 [Sedimentibacter sp. zth1]|uniref:hypothetical protein n=1 Tax=Sedimentibacter sp. zth1 TaxID=2816908 RepID=UPI001A91834F|nr:hypothetical protein [Sedimentibacter sp. zth1]QSX04667.1 hypothetical protein JYG23_08085 [Sedimentibacter sp. zth1]
MKKKIISIFLVISLLVNIGFIINISENKKEDDLRKIGIIAQADLVIDEAVNVSSNVVGEWDKLSNEELVQQLSQIEKELQIAIKLLNIADSYFYPLKSRNHENVKFYNAVIKDGKNEKLYKEYKEENIELRYLWKFLAENRIDELGIDEVILRWQNTENK